MSIGRSWQGFKLLSFPIIPLTMFIFSAFWFLSIYFPFTFSFLSVFLQFSFRFLSVLFPFSFRFLSVFFRSWLSVTLSDGEFAEGGPPDSKSCREYPESSSLP